MEQLIEDLIRKRLCLPHNVDIEKLYQGEIRSIIKHDVSHVCCAFTKKNNKINVLSYGYNIVNKMHIAVPTHAEKHCLDNIKRTSYLKQIDMLILRTSPTGKLGISKPCVKCLLDMFKLPKIKNYIIRNIYFSNNSGEIECKSLTEIINDNDFHVSQYYVNHNFEFSKKFNQVVMIK